MVRVAISMADSSLLQGNWSTSTSPPSEMPLFTVEGKPYLKSQFYEYVRQGQSPAAGNPADRMTALYNEYTKECLLAHEEEEIVRKNPDFAYLLNEYREGLLLFEIMETDVWGKASNDTIGQRAYFDAHALTYQWKERAEARVFSFDLSAERDSTLEGLSRNDSLSGNLKPQRGLFERGVNVAVDAAPWTQGLHAVDVKGKFYVVQVIEVKPPAPKQFGEARASVISDYQDELEKRWVASLRTKYKVNVNGKTRKHVLSQLVKLS